MIKTLTFYFNFFNVPSSLLKYLYFFSSRHDERRGSEPSGTRVPHAKSPGVPPDPVRHHARVLAQGPHEEADLRDAAVAAGRLLHPVRFRVQRSVGLLTISGFFPQPPTFHLEKQKRKDDLRFIHRFTIKGTFYHKIFLSQKFKLASFPNTHF